MDHKLTAITFDDGAQEIVSEYCRIKGMTPENLVQDWIKGMEKEIKGASWDALKDW